jgi:hypothetical protein
LFAHDPYSFWRRLLVIAFEDVGAGDPETLCAVGELSADAAAGKNPEIAQQIVCRLAAAPKDRSADYLLGAAEHHETLTPARSALVTVSVDGWLRAVENPSGPLAERAAAAWYCSGMVRPPSWSAVPGSLTKLAEAYSRLGIPDEFIAATVYAAKRTREPITLLPALVWLDVQRHGSWQVVERGVPVSGLIRGVPLYALDKHTRVGLQAIARFARESGPVRECLEAHIPSLCRRKAVQMAAFYTDAIPIARRLDWHQSAGLEAVGMESDMGKEGVPREAIRPLLAAVRGNLDHLNDIRAQSLRTLG